MGTRVISFLNIKGGVGKTISTTNIGAALDKMGYSVLIIDIDPQSNATKYLSSYKENDLSSYELLKGETGIYIKATKYNDLQIVRGIQPTSKLIRCIYNHGQVNNNQQRYKSRTRSDTWR